MNIFAPIIESITTNFSIGGFTISAFTVRLLFLLALALVVHLCVSRLLLTLIYSLIKIHKCKIHERKIHDCEIPENIFHESKNHECKKIERENHAREIVLRRAAHLIPASIISAGMQLITHGIDVPEAALIAISKILGLYYILISLAIFDSLLNVFHAFYDRRVSSKKVGITGVIQAIKVVGVIVSIVLAVSLLAGRSPIYFLSGLGAFTAILMLIFKDPILGLVAGVQLSAMDLVRKGDWVEIPQHGADGDVIDITLTTVMVRNWDKTITSIPAYELVASSFKNWRGMSESGGRRIKRSLRFSARSIRFLTDEEIEKLRNIKLLREYIDKKQTELCEFNETTFSASDLSMATNGRRLTNIGTYRAYCLAYLRAHPAINQSMTVMVRQLQSTELGLPLEIYAFTSDTSWIPHENAQSDIFDHFFAIVGDFGLEIYQR